MWEFTGASSSCISVFASISCIFHIIVGIFGIRIRFLNVHLAIMTFTDRGGAGSGQLEKRAVKKKRTGVRCDETVGRESGVDGVDSRAKWKWRADSSDCGLIKPQRSCRHTFCIRLDLME